MYVYYCKAFVERAGNLLQKDSCWVARGHDGFHYYQIWNRTSHKSRHTSVVEVSQEELYFCWCTRTIYGMVCGFAEQDESICRPNSYGSA